MPKGGAAPRLLTLEAKKDRQQHIAVHHHA